MNEYIYNTTIEVKEEKLHFHDSEWRIEVKEEKPLFLDSDWSIQNRNYVQNTNPDFIEAVGYGELKTYCYQRCFLCAKLFLDSYSLAQHNLSHIIIPLQVPNLYQCDYCLVYYTRKPDLISHIKAKHKALGVPKLKALHQCNICLKTFPYKAWHEHMKCVHGNTIKCHICNTVFKCQRYLTRHIFFQHEGGIRSDNKLIESRCKLCPKAFKTPTLLKVHEKNCHSQSAECKICKSTLKSMSYLNAHMRRVHYNDGKVHKCKICMKPFKSPRYVKIHVKNSHKNGRNTLQEKCYLCGKMYKKANCLDVHLKTCRLNNNISFKQEIKVEPI